MWKDDKAHGQVHATPLCSFAQIRYAPMHNSARLLCTHYHMSGPDVAGHSRTCTATNTSGTSLPLAQPNAENGSTVLGFVSCSRRIKRIKRVLETVCAGVVVCCYASALYCAHTAVCCYAGVLYCARTAASCYAGVLY
eukprot:1433720-Rhodomonas_salina.1